MSQININNPRVISNFLGEVLSVYSDNEVDITIKDINKLLTEPMLQPRFRLYLLNPDETIDYEIPQEDIIINSGSFNENYQNGQRKNINVSLINDDGKYTPSLNKIWVNTKFRLDIGLKNRNYENIYWFPRGIYILGNPSATRGNSEKQITLTLVDKFAYLEGKTGTLEATYEIPVGTNIENAIKGILTLDNGSGYPIDMKPIIYDSTFSGKIMPYTLKKDAGSTLADLILDIGTILNAEVYYNSMGNLCFININSTIDDINKPTLWEYSDTQPEYHNLSITCDFENAVNSIYIVGDNINNDLSYASAINDNPESAICVQYIGRRIEYINDTNIYNDTLAQERANYELRKHGILSTIINIEVDFNPLLFVNNLVTVTDSFLNYNKEKFLIQSISYNIGNDSKMNLSCSNLTNFRRLAYVTLNYVPCTSQSQAENLMVAFFGGTLPSGFSLFYDGETESEYLFGLLEIESGNINSWYKVMKETSIVIWFG